MVTEFFAPKVGERLSWVTFINFALVTTISLLLAGCGNPTSTAPSTPGQTSPGISTTAARAAIVQPKVVRTGTDAQGSKIEFTEPPALNDGIPGLLFFETEN